MDTANNTDTPCRSLEIANTIWAQIPIMEKMAAGLRKACATDNGMKCNFGRGNRRWLTVKLDGNDTYTVTATRMKRNFDFVQLGELSGIYADQLSVAIRELTNK